MKTIYRKKEKKQVKNHNYSLMPKNKQIQANQLFSVKEAAKYVKVSTSLIYKLIRKKAIPFTKIESKYLFSKENLDNWLESLTNKQ